MARAERPPASQGGRLPPRAHGPCVPSVRDDGLGGARPGKLARDQRWAMGLRDRLPSVLRVWDGRRGGRHACEPAWPHEDHDRRAVRRGSLHAGSARARWRRRAAAGPVQWADRDHAGSARRPMVGRARDRDAVRRGLCHGSRAAHHRSGASAHLAVTRCLAGDRRHLRGRHRRTDHPLANAQRAPDGVAGAPRAPDAAHRTLERAAARGGEASAAGRGGAPFERAALPGHLRVGVRRDRGAGSVRGAHRHRAVAERGDRGPTRASRGASRAGSARARDGEGP